MKKYMYIYKNKNMKKKMFSILLLDLCSQL